MAVGVAFEEFTTLELLELLEFDEFEEFAAAAKEMSSTNAINAKESGFIAVPDIIVTIASRIKKLATPRCSSTWQST